MPRPTFSSPLLRTAGPPALVMTVFLALTRWSWRKWPDPLLDFGKELYIAWQISEGEVLYRDLAHLFGPFSQYLNAAAFRLLGVSLSTLLFLNLLLLAASTVLLYRHWAALTDRFTAVAVSLLFLTLFAFGQYLPAGNLNFVSPYAHETTHGICLSLLLFSCLRRYQATPQLRHAGQAGLWFGLTFLTKAEIFAPAALALASWAMLTWLALRPSPREKIRAFIALGLAALLPPLLFFLFFRLYLPTPEAAHAITGAFQFLLKKEITQLLFYQKGMGTDALLPNLLLLLQFSAGIALVIAATLAGDYALCKSRLPYSLASFLFAAALFAIIIHLPPRLLPWHEIPRALPLTTLLLAGVFLAAAVSARANLDHAGRFTSLAVWAVWALALLGKIILNTHLYHYGFYLAMPATLLLAAALLGLIPQALKAKMQAGGFFRLTMLALWAGATLFYLQTTRYYYQNKTLRLGHAGDHFWAFQPRFRPEPFRMLETLAWIEQQVPSDSTLVAMPDGVMLNYLSRRKNPTPYLLFDPVVIMGYGETRVLESLQAHPPDYIILMHKDAGEFGMDFFGRDPRYGKQILAWVSAHYRPVTRFGSEPLRGQGFGVQVLQRRKD